MVAISGETQRPLSRLRAPGRLTATRRRRRINWGEPGRLRDPQHLDGVHAFSGRVAAAVVREGAAETSLRCRRSGSSRRRCTTMRWCWV